MGIKTGEGVGIVAVDKLSDAKVRALKPAAKPVKVFDGSSMYVHVAPTGAKSWRMAVRIDGKPVTLTRGLYPEVSLAEARAWRDAVRLKMRDGIDPREKAPTRKAMPTLKAVADAYWAGRKDVSPGYKSNAERAIERHVAPLLGTRPVDTITRDDLLDVLGRMDKAGLHVYVRKVRMWLGLVFDYAIEHGHRTDNPASAIRPERAFGKRPVQNFASVALHEVPELMARLALEKRIQSVLACYLLALTWVRTGELRMMKWGEIHGDLWRIPAGNMKKRREHLVPLSTHALAILAELKERSRGSEYVFPAEHRLDRPMSENAVLFLLHRIGYKGRQTGHGFRSIGSTWANEHGYNPDAIEMQLAHAPDDDTRAVYNKAKYLPERRRMLEAWGSWLTAP